MRLSIYQVDASTDSLFGGNPAAVCPLETWLPDATLQGIAAENNLSETPFFVREGSHYALRWFTPGVEGRPVRPRHARQRLCRHARLMATGSASPAAPSTAAAP